MATKDITDYQVCAAYVTAHKEWQAHEQALNRLPYAEKYARRFETTRRSYQVLQDETGQHVKVCWRAMERAYSRGLVEYGCNLAGAWLTEKGLALLGLPPRE